MNLIELLRRGEQVYDEVSAGLAPRDNLYCYALDMTEDLPNCKHRDHFGFCCADAKEQCLTIKDLLEKASERVAIS